MPTVPGADRAQPAANRQSTALNDSDKKDITIQDHTLVVALEGTTEAAEERIHQLLVIEGTEQGRMIELHAQSTVLGRAVPSDIVLRDVEISRSHCKIYREAGALHICDLKSTNGTFVDGQRVTSPLKLTDGCMLRIGRHQLKYECRMCCEIELSCDFECSLEGVSCYV